MFVKLIFNAQFCGYMEETILMSDNATEEDIKAKFSEHLDIAYDENCSYEILKQT